MPKDKEIHIICDNYATHKHDKVKAWQARNPGFHFHFTPTSASWLNMVKRFFRDLVLAVSVSPVSPPTTVLYAVA